MTVAEFPTSVIRKLVASNMTKHRNCYDFELAYGPWFFVFNGAPEDTLSDVVNYFLTQIAKIEGLPEGEINDSR